MFVCAGNKVTILCIKLILVCFKTVDLIVNSARSFTVAQNYLEFCGVQPFVTHCLNIVMFTVVQENPGNNKDLEDLPVLHEGQAVFFGK